MTLDYPTSAIQVTNTNKEQLEDFTDASLMQAIYYDRAEWAIEKLYERYKRYAYSLAYCILDDSFLAEDVVQDAFLALWHKAHSYHEQQGSVKSWLQAIIRNRAIDKLRSSTHRDYQCTDLQTVNELDLSSAQPEMWERVWEYEQSASIRKALAQLPAEQSQAIELSYFHGYTHAEIAKQLQISLGTVKGRMRLGLQKIKRLLQEESIYN
jgi:RNA polymerase sigma-70 factor (ECF subfamily)